MDLDLYKKVIKVIHFVSQLPDDYSDQDINDFMKKQNARFELGGPFIQALTMAKENKNFSKDVSSDIMNKFLKRYSPAKKIIKSVELQAEAIIEALEDGIKKIKAICEEDEEPTAHDVESFKDLIDDEMIGEFIDALLIKMGELEQEGKLELNKPKMVKAAVIAVIRKLASHSGIISRMASKFQRFGAKRFLRKARAEISKVL